MPVKRIKKILIHNATLAFLLTLPFAFLLHYLIEKYEIIVEGPVALHSYTNLFYEDLNGDGNSDKIYFGDHETGDVYCKVFDPAHKGQTNTSGRFVNPYFSILCADISGDSKKEIIFFTRKDSTKVILNIVDYEKNEVKEHEICELNPTGNIDFYANVWDYIDLNKDGQKELILSVQAGFPLQPRALYAFNPETKELKRTPLIGSKLGPTRIEDIDGDGFLEILASTYTTQNYEVSENFPYDDNASRLFVFDHNLKFKFPPLEFEKVRSQAYYEIIEDQGKKKIWVYTDTRGDALAPNKHFLVSPDGKILESHTFIDGDAFVNRPPIVFSKDSELLALDKEGYLYEVNPGVSAGKVGRIEESINSNLFILDVDGNGRTEYIFHNSQTGHVSILDENFKHPADFAIPGNLNSWISPVISKTDDNKYLIRNKSGYFYVTYGQNKLWIFRFVVLLAVFIFFYGLLWLINKIQAHKIYEKQSLEREMHRLQYQAITSRFSPHYTFNVLNNFSSQIYHKENPELYDYFNKFIRQLRYLYDDKNAVTRSLKEEIHFCRDYLDSVITDLGILDVDAFDVVQVIVRVCVNVPS